MWDFLTSLEWKTILGTSAGWVSLIVVYFAKRKIERKAEHDELDLTRKKLENAGLSASLFKEHGDTLKMLDQLKQRPHGKSLTPDEAKAVEIGVNQIILNDSFQIVELASNLAQLQPTDARWGFINTRAAVQLLRRFLRLHQMGERQDEALTKLVYGFDIPRLRLAMEATRQPMLEAFADAPEFQRELVSMYESDLEFLAEFKFPQRLK